MQKLAYMPSEKIKSVWSDEELFNIKKLLNKKHLVYLENEKFEIESGTSQDQIQIRVSLIKNDNSAYYPIECIFMKETAEGFKESDIAVSMLDYLDVYWANYFLEERNVFIPLDWSKHEFEGITFYMRGFVRNLQLEAHADEFLLKHGHGEYDIQSISSET
jgi:hypothetical protein